MTWPSSTVVTPSTSMMASLRFMVQMPTLENSTAKMASTTMTSVIAVTTDCVTPWPRLSVLGLTRSPKWQASSAISPPNSTDLLQPSQRLAGCTTRGSMSRNCSGSRPSCTRAAAMPPSIISAAVHSATSGSDSASASTLGATRRTVCEMPITDSASSSSVTRITPIWAVIAEPERPATMMAASSGPSSRSTARPRMLMTKMSAP
mmetsp:Transcript_37520/g.87496  ORF Transcript_37520/g.87496 Transcript_37520/m.87496 type:complete len:205 (+) Transcript_37520:1336-1950(+)